METEKDLQKKIPMFLPPIFVGQVSKKCVQILILYFVTPVKLVVYKGSDFF
jgi:hypothetical protein